MKVDFLQTADDEFVETIAYYNLQSEGLGLEFAAEVKRGLGRIVQYPAAWTPLSRRAGDRPRESAPENVERRTLNFEL